MLIFGMYRKNRNVYKDNQKRQWFLNLLVVDKKDF